jgi:uncharacterized protein (DUF58 family)
MTVARAGRMFGPALIFAGAVYAAPELVLLGLLALLAVAVTGLWSRFGLHDLHYERTMSRERTVWGQDVPLDIAVRNDKLLPVWWVSVDDLASSNTVVREQALVATNRPRILSLRSHWTVSWYQRVVRHLTISADRRGVYSFESFRVTVADLFGYGVAAEEREKPATLLVRPRTLPVRIVRGNIAPTGELRTRNSLFEDPALFAGVRPYHHGDPIRRVHWRATARTGVVVSKRYDPSRMQNILLALDVQTASGRIWTNDEELVESLIVAASSLARHALLEGAACGLAAMAWSRSNEAFALIAPRTGRDQLGTIADLLGRLDAAPSAPFEHLLVRLPQRLQPGTTIIVITARDPEPYAEALRKLDRTGYPVQVVGFGPNGPHVVAQARALRFTAMTGSLNPDWRTSDALVLAS